MQQLITELKSLNLTAMANYLEQQSGGSMNQNLSFEERLSLLLNAEITAKKNRKINRLLKTSALKPNTRIEDITYDETRGLSRELYLNLARLDFLKLHQNLIIVGSTGCGKTHLANAIGNKACIEGYTVKFIKLPIFLEELSLSHTNNSFIKILQQLSKIDLLILDDFGITKINDNQRHDLLTIIDDRFKLKSTIFTSQLPVNSWHDYLAEPTLADAILDRILSQSTRVLLQGESLRWDKVKT